MMIKSLVNIYQVNMENNGYVTKNMFMWVNGGILLLILPLIGIVYNKADEGVNRARNNEVIISRLEAQYQSINNTLIRIEGLIQDTHDYKSSLTAQ